MHRLRPLVALSAIGLLVTQLLCMFGGPPAGTLVKGVPRASDFLSFWGGAKALHTWDPASLYDHRLLWTIMHSAAPTRIAFDNLYPPPLYQAFELFLPLSYPAGGRLHLALMTGAMVGAMALLVRAVPVVAQADRRVLFGALAVSPVVYMNLLTGQLGGVWLCLLAGGVLLLRDGKAVVGGAVLGLLCVKPSVAAAVAAALALTGQGAALGGFVLGGATLLGGSLALDGTVPWRAWIELMTGDHLRNYGQVPQRQITLAGLVSWPMGERNIASLGSRIGTACGLVLALWLSRRAWRLTPSDPRWPLRFGLVLSAMLLALPHLVDYDTGLHGIGLLASAALLRGARRRTLGIGLLLAAFVTPVMHSGYELLHISGGALVLVLWLIWAALEDRRQEGRPLGGAATAAPG
ncbi:MAG: DUF2029 domain-containing protein [Deltaproteobacteria bacterium]|nr:DUF2029 domain-containing protein [Deltaproteobacteria bacterium]